MKMLAFAIISFGLLSAVGCDDPKTEPGERRRNAVENDVPATPDPDVPPSSDAGPSDASRADNAPNKPANDADLPTGVQEKPADELPKTDSEGKEETK